MTTILAEIDEIICLVEAEIPANQNSPSSLRQRERMRRDLAKYFKSLDNAFPYKKIAAIYNKYAEPITEVMTPSDWKAEYKKGVPHWAKDMEPSVFAEEFAKLMEAQEVGSVLEVGCGNGRDSILFAQSGFEVTSIDIVPKAVELAKKNANKAETDIEFKVANVEKLPFEDESFGAVFTLSVLHSTDLKKSLPEVARILKQDGIAFIYIYGDTDFKNGKPKEDTIKFNDYLKALKDVGFKVLKSYTEQQDKFDELGEKHRIFVVFLQKEI